MWVWYRENENGDILVLRMFGDLPAVSVPAWIAGKKVTGLAAYCFSEKSKYTGTETFLKMAEVPFNDQRSGQERETFPFLERGGGRDAVLKEDPWNRKRFWKEVHDKTIRELSGDMLTEVFLPDHLEKIGDFCFYQCRNLEKISLGAGVTEIGSDAFMNCKKLTAFFLRTTAEKETGIRQILLQRTGETEVFFDDAAIFFPEFSERYDLIGPAHIFELNIEGEGFRARQCFEKGKFLFEKYDQIFSPARDTEAERTLCKMAVLRLCYPLKLKEGDKEIYQVYLSGHMEQFCEELAERQDLSLLKDMGEQGLLKEWHIETALRVMMQKKWLQGTRMLLTWKREWQGKEKEQAYEFDEF